MNFSANFARIVALIGGAALLWRRRLQGAAPAPAWGAAPVIPAAKPQGSIPTLKMPTARGWRDGQKPIAAPGLKVNAFATGLEHPRWIAVLPNSDVLVAEATEIAGPIRSLFTYAMQATMRRAAALGVSANRITLLRDQDRDGVAERRETFIGGLNQPFGMALVGDTFYVGNTDGVVAFPYAAGADRITAAGRKLVTFKPSGHWTRSLLPSADGKRLYAGVGSLTNIADDGMEAERGRAAIYEIDLASGKSRIFAGGLRNPVGLAWEPHTGALWTVVNERDGLGDETPPDYLTSIREGGILRLAVLLLGADGGRSRAAGPCVGNQSHHARLCARRSHCVSRPVLAAGRHAAGLSGRHGNRAARLMESLNTQRLQGRVRAFRKWPPFGSSAGYSVGIPRAR
jgi:glucose/arabinose dehydrogenase